MSHKNEVRLYKISHAAIDAICGVAESGESPVSPTLLIDELVDTAESKPAFLSIEGCQALFTVGDVPITLFRDSDDITCIVTTEEIKKAEAGKVQRVDCTGLLEGLSNL